jgi:hypothetical protein
MSFSPFSDDGSLRIESTTLAVRTRCSGIKVKLECWLFCYGHVAHLSLTYVGPWILRRVLTVCYCFDSLPWLALIWPRC